jgi:hypothetical protein
MSMNLKQSTACTHKHDMVANVDDSLVEKVWHDLNGEVSREQIRRVIAEIAATFQDAPVQTFAPIFIHRQALERLKSLSNNKIHPATRQILADGEQRRGNESAAAPIINQRNKGKTTMKKLAHLLHLSLLIFILAACSGTAVESGSYVVSAAMGSVVSGEADTAVTTQQTITSTAVPIAVNYDSEDLETSTESTATTTISLEGDAISVTGEGAVVNASSVTITAVGTYSLSGTLNDGQIIVETADTGPVVLILNGVDITYATSAPIYVSSAEKVVITLAEGTENVVTDGDTYQFPDAETNEPNAAIFSNDDLTINGSGSLIVNANYNNGIDSNDDLKIIGGNITVNAVNDGIKGRDSIAVKDGVITINAGADGMQSNNDEDVERGYIVIEGGTLNITAELDGIQAETSLLISGGDINITTGGGSGNSSTTGGGMWGAEGNPSATTVSAKGLKAGADITVTAGTITINSADDAVHSNGTMTINGGSITLASGDDGMHADTSLEINDGEINLTQSYEGLESALITINGGNIHLVASDDGINVAGGNDGSAVNGRPGQNEFAASGNYHLYINGGYIYVDAGGDGLDSNGAFDMTDGIVIVNGPTNNGNGPLDYMGSFNITGGSATGADTDGLYADGAYTAGTQAANYTLSSVVTSNGGGMMGGFDGPDSSGRPARP